MALIGALSVPVIVSVIIVFGLLNKVKIFECFTCGAKEGLKVAFHIFPSLLGLTTAVAVLKASGVLELIAIPLTPLMELIKMPKEVLPLALMRPVSGSGAVSILKDILSSSGPDSFSGKLASVIMGSTETTFYTVAVYYGVVNITKTRHTLRCALTADLVGIISAVIFTRLLL